MTSTTPTPEAAPSEPSMRTLAVAVLLPTFVFQITQGAMLPVVAITALNLHASVGIAALMLSLIGIGQLLGDVPAGALSDRVGDRYAMMLAACLAMAAQAGCYFARSVPLFAVALIVYGMANSTFALSRQTYLSETVAPTMRARMMSSVGGVGRIGQFVGPFLSAAAIAASGFRSAYLVAACAAGVTLLLLVRIPDLPRAASAIPHRERQSVPTRQVFAAHRRLFATLGATIFAVGAVRAIRQTVLPLWANHVGASAATVSIIFGIASAADMSLFYPAGKVMDTWGRRSVGVASMTCLGVGLMLLPLTHSVGPLIAVAVVIGVGNGIGSGVMMTLGADAAPTEGRGRFLGIWRLYSDTGNASGPVLLSGLTALWILGPAIAVSGSLGLLAAAGLAVWTPKYSKYATRRGIRAELAARSQRN